MKIISTRQSANVNGIKVLVYGKAGAGKTVLSATAPNPIILSAEAGLLSIADKDLPVIDIKNVQDLEEVYNFFLSSEEAKKYTTICLDSISEISEQILSHNKQINKDPRQAYGAVVDQTIDFIKKFRDLQGFNVYFSCKEDRITDTVSGITQYGPLLPGSKLGVALPYFFDGVYNLNIGRTEDGQGYRYLRTESDLMHIAKDRSGRLDAIERADLTYIFNKLKGEANNGTI